MQTLELGVVTLVRVVLPCGGGGVTIKHSAPERPNPVDAAQAVDLEDAGPAVVRQDGQTRPCRPFKASQLICKCDQLHCGDVQPMSVRVEPAALAGGVAPWPMLGDFFGDAGVQICHRREQLGACGGTVYGLKKLFFHWVVRVRPRMLPVYASARHSSLSGVIGSDLTRLPVAWYTALAIAAATPTMPISPTPFAPSGFTTVSCSSTKITSI